MYESQESRRKRRKLTELPELPELIEHLSLHRSNDQLVEISDESDCSFSSQSSLINVSNDGLTYSSSAFLLSLLESHIFFAKLSKAVINRLIDDMHRHEYQKDEVIQSADRKHDQFFVVESGQVRAGGHMLSQGHTFGDCCLGHAPLSCSLIASVDSSLVVAATDHAVIWSISGAVVRQHLLVAEKEKQATIMHFLNRLRIPEHSSSNSFVLRHCSLNACEIDLLSIECDLVQFNQGECILAPGSLGLTSHSVLVVIDGELGLYRTSAGQSVESLRASQVNHDDLLAEGCVVCSIDSFRRPVMRPSINSFVDAPRHSIPAPRTRKRAREEGMCVSSTTLSTILEDDAQQPERPSTPPTSKLPMFNSEALAFNTGRRESACMRNRYVSGPRTRSSSLVNPPLDVTISSVNRRNILSSLRRSESSPAIVTSSLHPGLCIPSICTDTVTILCHSLTSTMLAIPISVLKLPVMNRLSQYLSRNINQRIALA